MNTPGVHYPHRIRLRGPWKTEPGTEGIRSVRRFGYPGRIDDFERVWIVFDKFASTAHVTLNGTRLGRSEQGGSFAFDVTRLLTARNELVLEIDANSERGEAALEIRRTAFLSGVKVRRDENGLKIRGTVVGTAERPLDLYFLVDGTTAGYETVEPIETGRDFEMTADRTGKTVRVELVDGGCVWYSVELSLAEQ
jgi:hypothetical protein